MKSRPVEEPSPKHSARSERSTPARRGLAVGWKRALLLLAWVFVLVVWIQFAFASLDELEPQAASLGSIVVVILMVGGVVVWMAKLQSDRDR